MERTLWRTFPMEANRQQKKRVSLVCFLIMSLKSWLERQRNYSEGAPAIGSDEIAAGTLKVAIETTVVVMKIIIYWYTRVWNEDLDIARSNSFAQSTGNPGLHKLQECNSCNHALKVLLQVLRQCLSTYSTTEIADEQIKRSNRHNSGNKKHDWKRPMVNKVKSYSLLPIYRLQSILWRDYAQNVMASILSTGCPKTSTHQILHSHCMACTNTLKKEKTNSAKWSFSTSCLISPATFFSVVRKWSREQCSIC